jgi:hypothetical protein
MITKMYRNTINLFLFCGTCFLIGVSSLWAQPVLEFDQVNGFNWKQIFVAGFRPRHHNGGRTTCSIWHQEPFFLHIKELDEKMLFDKGRLDITFDSKEKINGVSYYAEESIDMEEGKRRVDQFTQWLKPYVIHEMTMPRYIFGTRVDATGRHCVLVARMGEYLIQYRFGDTASPTKQLKPRFSISWSYPGKPMDHFIPLDREIKPPPGYEDYDMTEVLQTSYGEVRIGDKVPTAPPKTTREENREARKKAMPLPAIESSSTSSFWWQFGIVILFLTGLGWYIKRRLL